MFDHNKIDSYFNQEAPKPAPVPASEDSRHSRLVRLTKLTLPAVAAILAGLLLIIPLINNGDYDLKFDITKPKAGEMEKLHIENTVFNITDKDNQVQNFTASNIDETEPGSKLIKLSNPEGSVPQKGNEWVNIKSSVGFFNQNTNVLNLTENVELFYSEGMNIQAQDVFYDFNSKTGNSQKPVTGQGVFGDIQSEGFSFFTETAVLIFNGKTHIKVQEESFKRSN